MADLKIGLAQFHSAGLDGSLKHIRDLLEKGAELVVLPEKWMNGGDGNVVTDDHPFLKNISNLSREYGAAVLTGALIEREGDRSHITCYCFGDEGELLAKCRKLHPFGFEKKSISPGDRLSYFDFRGIRIGVAICYDMDFPETVRLFAVHDCDLIAVPTKIRKEGIDPWLIYLQARALENRIPVAFANEVNPPHFDGRSGVIDLTSVADGMIMLPRTRLMNSDQGMELFDVDPASFREARKKRMSDRNMKTDVLEMEKR